MARGISSRSSSAALEQLANGAVIELVRKKAPLSWGWGIGGSNPSLSATLLVLSAAFLSENSKETAFPACESEQMAKRVVADVVHNVVRYIDAKPCAPSYLVCRGAVYFFQLISAILRDVEK